MSGASAEDERGHLSGSALRAAGTGVAPDAWEDRVTLVPYPDDAPPPVMILAGRECGGSALAAALGGLPGMGAAAPHLNLLAFPEPWQLLHYAAIPRDSQLHGLLRMIAQLTTGEETIESGQAALRWLARRDRRPATAVLAELSAMAGGRLADYSPLLVQDSAVVRRAVAAVPSAHVIHLVRHPAAQAMALARLCWDTVHANLDFWQKSGRSQPPLDIYEMGEQLIDWSCDPPLFDPQFAWVRQNAAIRMAARPHDPARCITLRIEDLAADPEVGLVDLAARLGLTADRATVAAMLDAPLGRLARTGPYTAPFGTDPSLIGVSDLRSAFHALTLAPDAPCLPGPDGALPWRGDGGGFLPQVAALAQMLGYDLAP